MDLFPQWELVSSEQLPESSLLLNTVEAVMWRSTSVQFLFRVCLNC